MKKRYIICLFALLAALCGCQNEKLGVDGPAIRISFRTPGADVALKADAPGDDAFNENLLNSFYYFLYQKDAAETAPLIKGYVAGISVSDKYEITVPVSANDLNELFKESRECSMFVVANPSDDLVSFLKGGPTLAQLRSKVVLSSLDGKQDNFVMVYDDYLTLGSHSSESAIVADVLLKHLACKFTFNAHVAKEVRDESILDKDGNPVVWKPVTDGGGLNVVFGNALNRSTLGGFDAGIVGESDYFETSPIALEVDSEHPYITVTEGDASVEYYNFQCTAPAYSYPMEWEFTDKFEPYLMFELTWTDGTNFVPRYYKLMLGQNSITSNDWYDISAKLTILGSLSRKDPVVQYLYLDYQVLGWREAFHSGTDVKPNTPAVIVDSRYLMVPQTEWTLYNQNSVSIPFSSSHPCKIYIKQSGSGSSAVSDIWHMDLKNVKETKSYVSNALSSSDWKFDVDMANSRINFEHKLNNKIETGMDYTPYDITFYIYHDDQNVTDNDSLDEVKHKEMVHIVQYPAMSIVNEASGDKATNPGGSSTANKTLWINNDQNSGTGWDHAHTGNTTSGGNENYNMIILSVSVIGEEFGIIGDPRSHTAKTGANLGTDVNKDKSGRALTYYYSTDTSLPSSIIIAPKLRISSAHAMTDSNAFGVDGAEKRCATYQQDGYPAGRWRLPTDAEMKFMTEICAQGLIPPFFNNNANYWSATTLYKFNSGSVSPSTDSQGYCRCVYDEWYWEQETPRTVDKDTFTYGDKQIW